MAHSTRMPQETKSGGAIARRDLSGKSVRERVAGRVPGASFGGMSWVGRGAAGVPSENWSARRIDTPEGAS